MIYIEEWAAKKLPFGIYVGMRMAECSKGRVDYY